VSITNVAPTAVIEQPQSVMVRGARTVIARSGAPVAVTGRATDPGSDDLTLTWTWHDGTPDTARVSLVNPPGADTYPSPSVQPRDVTDPRSHSYAPCLYDLVFRVSDDDGAAASDSVKLLVTGTSTERAAAGYWQQQYTGERAFTPATLTCYLRIAGFVSSVFDEASNASTIANAYDVLRVGPKPSAQAQFDRQLLTALLNFANGSIGADELVDTNHDHVPDTPFLTVIASVEAIRLNPSSSDAQILAAKDVLEQAGQAGSDL
jgi:hypothetical protein